MKGLLQLQQFYATIASDARIGATHISIYMALFQLWQLNGCNNPVPCQRRRVMELAKVSSRTTYHKILKELVSYGYIQYQPSFSPTLASLVTLQVLQQHEPVYLSRSR